MVIVDPKKRKALKAITEGQLAAALEGSGDGLSEANSYPQKYREIVFFNKIGKDLSSLIDKFLDGQVHHFY